MKTNVKAIGDNEVELTVEVPAADVRKAYDRTLAEIRSEIALPGFRKGHVPVALVIQQVGEDFVRGETLENAVPVWGDQALNEAGLLEKAVGTSDLKAEKLDETADYSFTLHVQTMPVPVLGEYKGLKVPKRIVEVTDAQVEAQLAMLQERLAKLEPVEGRAVQKGDFVLMDLEGSRDGEPIEGAEGKDQMFEIGRGNLIPGFEEALVGVTQGEETSFDVEFPDDYHAEELQGQPATFTVTVKEIKEKVVPDLDDPFAADVSEFETIDELRADVRQRLEAAADAGAQRDYRAAAVDQAADNATVDIPEVMVHREAHRLFHELEESVGERGLTMDVYLGVLDKTAEQVEEELHPQAEQIIKRRLVLEAIAEDEKLEISDDEITDVVKRDAEALGRDHLQLLGDLEKSGRREALRDEMLLAKTVDFVADAAESVPMTEAEEEAAAEAAADAAEDEDDEA